MEEITTLVATLVLPATVSVVPVCFAYYSFKGREKPLREAVNKAQTLVANGAVWLALALAGLYSVLESLNWWGVWPFLAVTLGPSVVLGVVFGVVMICRQRRQAATTPESFPAMTRTCDETVRQ